MASKDMELKVPVKPLLRIRKASTLLLPPTQEILHQSRRSYDYCCRVKEKLFSAHRRFWSQATAGKHHKRSGISFWECILDFVDFIMVLLLYGFIAYLFFNFNLHLVLSVAKMGVMGYWQLSQCGKRLRETRRWRHG